MKKKRRSGGRGILVALALAAAVAAGLAATSAFKSPKVEIKDPQSFAKTIAALKESLSDQELEELQASTLVVVHDTLKQPVPLMKVTPEQWAQVRARIDGKTPRQIRAMADEIRARAAAPGAPAAAEAPAGNGSAPGS
ncbi:MAG: hypothetical protein ACKO0W_00330 [Planctomycetota bacterium]